MLSTLGFYSSAKLSQNEIASYPGSWWAGKEKKEPGTHRLAHACNYPDFLGMEYF